MGGLAPWMTPGGHNPVTMGGAAATVSVTATVVVLFVAAGALIVTLAEYTLGASPVGFTVTAMVLNSPTSEMFPAGVTVSQDAPVTLTVAETADPLLARMNALEREGFGTGAPVT